MCDASIRPKFSLQRRLRIRTIQYTTAGGINDLYDNVDPETVLCILVHKVLSFFMNFLFYSFNLT